MSSSPATRQGAHVQVATQFAILGPLEVRGEEGEPLPSLVGRPAQLLTGLLLRANRQVPADTLVELLWAKQPPTSYLANLQTYVSRLRRQLGVRIVRQGGGYVLSSPPGQIDAERMTSHAAAGRAAMDAGDLERAAERFGVAVALYRSAPFAGMDAGPFQPDVVRLDEIHHLTLEGLTETDLVAGRYDAAIVRLRALTAGFPLRESLWAHLVQALAWSGRTAEALDAFQEVRRFLCDELGTEPGESLQQVHRAVLRGEAPVVGSGAPHRSRPVCQLPRDVADFTGREGLVAELVERLGRSRAGTPVVVLSGLPGVGKTTLAVRVAHALRDVYPDGQFFARLVDESARPRAAADVLLELLRGVGVGAAAVPEGEAARAAAWRAHIADRRALVVLDDASTAEQLMPMLPGTSGSAALVTSRRRLADVPAGRLVLLDPLTDDEAFAMLGRIVGEDRVDGEPAAAAKIREYSANLPLALRVAGARIAGRPELTLSRFVASLADERGRLGELTVDALAVRVSVHVSYAALDPLAQRAFRLTALLGPRDLSVHAVAALLAVDTALADSVIGGLVQANLLEPVDVANREPRYRMHDMLRTFGQERALAEETDEARAAAQLGVVEAALGGARLADGFVPRASLTPPPPGEEPAGVLSPELARCICADPLGWLEVERANLVAACLFAARSGWPDLAVGLAANLHARLWNDGYLDELGAIYQAVRAMAVRIDDPRVLAWAAYMNARTASLRGEVRTAVDGFIEVKEQAARLGMTQLYAYSLASLSFYLADAHDGDDTAIRYGRTAVRLFRCAGDPRGEAEALRATALALNRPDRADRALAALDRAAHLSERVADPLLEALLLNARVGVLCSTRRYVEAEAHALRCVDLLRGLGERSVLSYVLSQLGYVRLALHRPDQAVADFAASLELGHEIGDRMLVASASRNIALGLCRRGMHEQAIEIVGAAAATFRDLTDAPRLGLTLRLLSDLYLCTGGGAAAADHAAQADQLLAVDDALTTERLRLLRMLITG